MGYDTTYHPIKETELNDWYFNLDFDRIKKQDYSEIEALAASFNLESQSLDFYKSAVDAGAKAEPDGAFEHTHGYFAAAVQGCFKQFFYLRNAAFSLLIADKPAYKDYTKPWEEILNRQYANPVINQLDRNYSSGVYIPTEKLVQLLSDYESGDPVKQDLDNFFSDGRIEIFLKALRTAASQQDGLLEASEIIIPNPLNLDETWYYTNLLNCDIEGAILYQKSSQATYREIEKREGMEEGEFARKATFEVTQIPEPKPQEKKGFFKRLFE